MKIFFLLILGIVGYSVYSQEPVNALSKIRTVSEAEELLKNNLNRDVRLFTISSGTDTNALHMPLFEKGIGFTFSIDHFDYKVLQVDSVLSYNVNYIFLNGNSYPKVYIDSLINDIITQFKGGRNFFELVLQYNMDGNLNGSTGWFTDNMMVKSFENAVKTHNKGDIFIVDTPEENWYHVVLKTHEDAFIKTVTVLRIKGG